MQRQIEMNAKIWINCESRCRVKGQKNRFVSTTQADEKGEKGERISPRSESDPSERASQLNVQVNLSERATSQSNRGRMGDIVPTRNQETDAARSRMHQPRLRFHGNVAVSKRRRHRLGRAVPYHATPRHATPRYAYVTARHWHTRPCHTVSSSASTACKRRPPAGQKEGITSHVSNNYHSPRITARTSSDHSKKSIWFPTSTSSTPLRMGGRTNGLMARSHGVPSLLPRAWANEKVGALTFFLKD